jgi:predicted Zn-dependent protease
MAILSKDEARQLLEKVVGFSQADDCTVNLNGSTQGNVRYARNTVTTSGGEDNTSLAVTSAFGKKSGTATINELDDASLEKVVRRSEELARLAPDNPEYVGPLGPQEYAETPTFVQSTADITPAYRAQVAADSIGPAKAEDVTAAGFFENDAGFSALMNSEGLFAYERSTGLDFSVTMRTQDGTGSGYVSRDYNDVEQFDSAEMSQIALDKALMSRNPKAIEPGKYTVILEPTAAVQLLQNMLFNMGARSADEGRSFLSKAKGETKVGEKIVDERVTIYSDPTNERVPASAWDGEGRPRERTAWIENGVVKNLYYSRFWAQKQGVQATPSPANGIMEGGDATVEEMIAGTDRGILVTRLWYIRTVDPQTLLYTGLTRDGTFYIENGKIAYPVKNFRFNESPVIMLNNLEELGAPIRVNGSLVPPMKIRDFTFTSLSDAI